MNPRPLSLSRKALDRRFSGAKFMTLAKALYLPEPQLPYLLNRYF